MVGFPAGISTSVAKAAPNAVTSTGQNQMGGTGEDVFAASQSINKGGMRGIGLVAAIIAEIVLKEKVISLAKSYYRTNKKDYDFYSTSHKGPLQESVNEAFGPDNPTYTPDLYAFAPAGMAKSSIIDRQWFEARRRIPKYNIGQQRRLDYDMAIARTHAVVAGWNVATRYAINWADERNNRAFKRKVEMANVGINTGNTIRDGMARAVDKLSSAYDGLGDTIASIGNGYAAKTGFQNGRDYAKQQFAAKNQLPTGMRNG